MIQELDHIAIICSNEKCIEFYEDLGFKSVSKISRPKYHDIIIFMEGYGQKLEIFIDNTHPLHVTNPEAYGLRHLAFKVDNIEEIAKQLNKYNPEPIRIDKTNNTKYLFIKDLDGLPIELRE